MRPDEVGLAKGRTSIMTGGGLLDLTNPKPLFLSDIAPALFRVRRWSGHGRHDPPTIGAHLLHVAQIMRVELNVRDKTVLLGGLLHDVHEAFYGDVSRPLKGVIRAGTDAYDDLETLGMDAVTRRFAPLSNLRDERIHQADHMGAGWEAVYLFGTDDGCPWGMTPAHSGLLCEPSVERFLMTAEHLGAVNVRRERGILAPDDQET